MNQPIRLLASEHGKERGKNRQKLEIHLLVKNLAYDKQVAVVYCGQQNSWHTQPAQFVANRGDGWEIWRAQLSPAAGSSAVRYYLRLDCQGQSYRDDCHGRYYHSRLGGLRLAEAIKLHNLSFDTLLAEGQRSYTVRAALNTPPGHSPVIYWTTDDWRHCRHTTMSARKHGRPGQTALFSATLKIGEAYRLQYAICSRQSHGELWDNNGGANYHASRAPLKLLILNLHCYQETNQDEKFSRIAQAIDELQADLVCFQEVAEYWNNGHGDWPSNSAHIINQRLKTPYQLHSDWSHLGFERYREGVAILSRHPLLQTQSRYVSVSTDAYDIHARKVVMAELNLRYFGRLQVYSVHLSWWENGFAEQCRRLLAWAASEKQAATTVLLCGDFNVRADSDGYRMLVDTHRYQDQFLAAAGESADKLPTDSHWRQAQGYGRIDFVFMNEHGRLAARAARTVFTEHDYGPVSDHCGYLLTFEPKH